MPVRLSPILRALRARSTNVPRRVRAFREAAGLTQEALARRAHLTAKYISEIENGRTNPSIGVIAQLVEHGLGVPLAAFFGADMLTDVRDDLAKLEALFAAQPAAMRRRALRVLKALCDE